MKLLDLPTPGKLPHAARVRSLVVQALSGAQVYKARTAQKDPSLETFITFLEAAVAKARTLR